MSPIVWDKVWGVVKGAVIASIGFLLAYFTDHLADLGLSPLQLSALTAVLSILTNGIKQTYGAITESNASPDGAALFGGSARDALSRMRLRLAIKAIAASKGITGVTNEHVDEALAEIQARGPIGNIWEWITAHPDVIALILKVIMATVAKSESADEIQVKL